MWYVWGPGEVHTGFRLGGLREGDHMEYIDIDGRIIIKWTFIMSDGDSWTGLLWLGIGTGGRLL